jgi:hypothetical protein
VDVVRNGIAQTTEGYRLADVQPLFPPILELGTKESGQRAPGAYDEGHPHTPRRKGVSYLDSTHFRSSPLILRMVKRDSGVYI